MISDTYGHVSALHGDARLRRGRNYQDTSRVVNENRISRYPLAREDWPLVKEHRTSARNKHQATKRTFSVVPSLNSHVR